MGIWGSLYIMWFQFSMPFALAEEKPYSFGVPPQRYFNTGVTAGSSFSSLGKGRFLGIECNYVRSNKGMWAGLYTDALYDFGNGNTMITIGPKIGMYIIGLDGGIGIVLDPKDQRDLQMQGRILLTFGVFSMYYRYGIRMDTDISTHQIGLSIKMPFPLNYEPRRASP